VVADDLFQILYLSQLLEAGINDEGEVCEKFGALWMMRWMKGETFSAVLDCLLEVVHSSALLKSFAESRRQVAQQISALDIFLRTLLEVESMMGNFTIQFFTAVCRILKTELASNMEQPLKASPCSLGGRCLRERCARGLTRASTLLVDARCVMSVMVGSAECHLGIFSFKLVCLDV